MYSHQEKPTYNKELNAYHELSIPHTDPEQGPLGPKLTNVNEQCSVNDLPKLDDWRKN